MPVCSDTDSMGRPSMPASAASRNKEHKRIVVQCAGTWPSQPIPESRISTPAAIPRKVVSSMTDFFRSCSSSRFLPRSSRRLSMRWVWRSSQAAIRPCSSNNGLGITACFICPIERCLTVVTFVSAFISSIAGCVEYAMNRKSNPCLFRRRASRWLSKAGPPCQSFATKSPSIPTNKSPSLIAAFFTH